jgi:hypothetical protein
MPVKVIGADVVARNFNALNVGAADLQKQFLDIISKETIRLLQLNTPKETGKLAASWHETGRTHDTITISIDDPEQAKKAKYLVGGTKPHTIRPRNPSGFLHWVDPKTGQDVLRVEVNNPGTQPNDFLVQVLTVIGNNVNGVMRKLMRTSHPYYSNVSPGVISSSAPQGLKGVRTPSNIVGLTGLRYIKKRGRGRSSLRIVYSGRKRITTRIGRRRKT